MAHTEHGFLALRAQNGHRKTKSSDSISGDQVTQPLEDSWLVQHMALLHPAQRTKISGKSTQNEHHFVGYGSERRLNMWDYDTYLRVIIRVR